MRALGHASGDAARTSPFVAARTACMCSRARTAKRRRARRSQAAAHVAAARHGWRPDHAGTGARPALAAAHHRHASGDAGGDRGGDRALRPVRADGRHVRLARSRRRRAGDRDQPRRWTCWRSKLASVRTLGTHPADKEPVSVRKGRFGPYVQHGKMVANVPRGVTMDDITLGRRSRCWPRRARS